MFRERTRLLVLVLALMVPDALPAQERAVELGVVGGINRSTMTGIGPVDAELAGQAGLFAQFRVGSRFAFRPEMSVSWKRIGIGGSPLPCDPGPCPLADQVSYIPNPQTTSLSWLEVPLLAQFSLPRIGSSLTPRLIAGPYVAVRLSCSVSGTPSVIYDLPVEPQGPVAVSQSCGEGTTSLYSNGDAGYVLGAGIGTKQLGVGLRWTRSMVATVPFSQLGNSPFMGGKQSTLAITVDLGIQ